MNKLKRLFAATGSEPPPPPVWSTLRDLPGAVWFVFLGTFINKFGTFVVPFLALHVTRMGFTTRQAGLALASYGTGVFCASAIGGHLADTFGRRRTIVLSMICGALCMVALSQAAHFYVLVALAFLTGMTGEMHRPASSALIADLVPEEKRVAAYAGYRFAINAGFAFGPAVAGLIAKHSYVWLFIGDAATSALYGVLAFAFLPRDTDRLARAPHWTTGMRRSVAEAFGAAFKDPRFVRLAIGCFGVGMVFFQLFSTLGLHVKSLGYPEATFGLILTLNGVVVVLCEIPICSVTQKLQPRPVIALGFALIATGAGLFAFVTQPWGFAVGMVILTIGETISMPVATAYAARMAPADMRGRYMGAYGLTWSASLIAGPWLGTALFGWWPASLWIACGAVGLMASVTILSGEGAELASEARPAVSG